MKRLLLLLLACTVITFSYAQQNRLLFQSGTMNTTRNVEQFITDGNPQSDEIFNGYFYRIIQFNDIPSSEQKAALTATGIILMNYFPEKAFVAAIPVNYNRQLLQQYNVFAVIKQDVIQKINRNLLGTAPEYSKQVAGFTDVMVQYYKNVSHATVVAACSGYEKIGENKSIQTVTLRIPENGVLALASQPWVYWISPAGVPSYKEDTKGRSLHRSNVINSDYASGRHYDGTGVVVGIADDGIVGPHIDFTGRLTNHLTSDFGSHGDMTSGICVGAGNLDPTIRGMATNAYMHIYDISGYPHIIDAVTNYDSLGTVILSTSYSQGCNEYTVETQFGDQLIHQNPQLEFLFSAGNNGQGSCTANPYGAGPTWGTITGGYKEGKNVITVGDLNANDVIESTSSRGPAHDGRIKPDICANGRDQLSTDGNNTYQVGGGTSAASPGVAGVMAQLYQAYKELNGGNEPESPLIKACLLNGAEDLGNEGPDYTYGWGRVNAYRALTTLEDGRYIKDSISQGDTNIYNITVPPGVSEIKVMIYWNDPEGTPGAATALVNDINMHLTDPINFVWNPWTLDPTPNATTLALPATKGTDNLNNMEQVSVPAGFQGNWKIHVNGFNIPQGPQTYYIVYEFRTEEITVTYPQGGEGFVPGETEVIRWDGVKGIGSYTFDYSIDNGANWILVDNAINQNANQYNWAVPSTVTGEALVRITRGANSGVSDSLFAIIGVPTNLNVAWSCVDSVRLEWDAVQGAVGYNIYKLGATQMENVGTSTTNNFVVTGTNPTDEYWFSVDAITAAGTKGRRAYAINKLPGVINCPLSEDGGLVSIISPAAGVLTDCQGNNNLSVTVVIENTGVNNMNGLIVSYALNNGTIVSDTLTDTITSGNTLVHAFSVPVDYSVVGNYSLTAWLTFAGDLNAFNDTLTVVTSVISGTLEQLPYVENFDSYSLCPTTTNCEATVCPIGNGWMNDANLVADDIDWRLNAGGTPSQNTGPGSDHTLGTNAGQYIYLEASACFVKIAQLLTPCIDLTTVTGPELSFWTHMNGQSMGEMHVDVLSNGSWTIDVMNPIIGAQQNAWVKQTVNLDAFAGEIITIRFRGITGTGATSDMAIDDINIINTDVPPVPAFNANFTSVCLGNTVTLNDNSLYNPTTWQWNISPSTFTYVNGTADTSQNPQIQFSATGTYTVELIASNSFGTDTIAINAYINVVTPSSLTLTEDFEASFPPAGWRVEASANPITWAQRTGIIGRSGSPTSAAYMNNFDQVNGSIDGLARLQIDLGSANVPRMTFDVAYTRANPFANDGLRIDISTDCGNTYTPSTYFKQGVALATTPNNNQPFVPSAGNQWRNDTLDLTSYAGQIVTIKFVSLSASGNNLYIDNLNITDANGVNESALNAIVNIFPNPSINGLFNISVNGIGADAILTVTDVQGKIVEQRNETIQSGYRGIIDLSSKDKGIYFLEIRTAEGVSRYKLSVI